MSETPIVLLKFHEDETPTYTCNEAKPLLGYMKMIAFITDDEEPETVDGPDFIITPNGPIRLARRHPYNYYTYREAPELEYDRERYELWLAAHENWQPPLPLFCTRNIEDFPEAEDDEGKPLATLTETPHKAVLSFRGGPAVHALNLTAEGLLKRVTGAIILNCDEDDDNYYETAPTGTILLTRDKKAYVVTIDEAQKASFTETDFTTVPHNEHYAERWWGQCPDPDRIKTQEELDFDAQMEAEFGDLDARQEKLFEWIDQQDQAREAKETEAKQKALPSS